MKGWATMLSAVRGKLRSAWAKRGSIEISTVLELLAVVVAASAAIVAGCAARDAKSTANSLNAIEEERHDDERLQDLVAAQISNYFSSSCEQREEMLAPKLDRFYDLTGTEAEGIDRAEVREECDDVDDDNLEFVLHEVEVIGTPESDHAYAFAKLGYYNAPTEHELVGTTSLEIVMKLEEGWEDDEKDPTFPITSMAETIVCEPHPDDVSAEDWPCPS
jgi:hypothetical protein